MKKYIITFFLLVIITLLIYLLSGKTEKNTNKVIETHKEKQEAPVVKKNSNGYILLKPHTANSKIYKDSKQEYHTNKSINFANVKPTNLDWIDTDTVSFDTFHNDIRATSFPVIINIDGINWYDKEPIKPVNNLIHIAANDGLAFISNFTRWDSSDAIRLISISALTAFLMSSDESIRSEVLKNNSTSIENVSKVSELYGRTITTELTAAAVELYGIIQNDKKAIFLGFEIYESYLITDNLHKILKYTFGRSRPNAGESAFTFKSFPSRGINVNSFPSGHAALAFSLSTVLASATDNEYLKALIYIPAFFTALSRVYDNVHWASDIFLGSALGYFVADFLVNRHRGIPNNNLTLGLDNQGRVGLKYFFK